MFRCTLNIIGIGIIPASLTVTGVVAAGGACSPRKLWAASVVRHKRCAGVGTSCCVLHGKERKLAKGYGGWFGFDRGAGLIAIMIWPITV